MRLNGKYALLLFIPLSLAAFTHIYNFTGFPCLQFDEGKYVRRAFHVLEGLGPQDPESRFDHGADSTTMYDHPYFGQLFLAGIFWITGYPDSLNINLSSSDYDSLLNAVESLWGAPRLLMGLLAVLDTYLIFRIAEMRYNRTTGFIASLFFAVLPLTWMTRWVVLESILLPFMLSSILLAIYVSNSCAGKGGLRSELATWRRKRTTLILLSGTFLGIAIFTKIPAFTMIPLVGSIVFFANGRSSDNSNKSFRTSLTEGKKNAKYLGIWFIPVLLIPLIWPLYALYTGDFESWLEGVLWQSQRVGTGVMSSLEGLYANDPILLILGISGIIYSVTRKDFFSLLWMIPFLIFAAFIGWIMSFHWLIVIPAFCISASFMIVDILDRVLKKRKYKQLIPYIIGSGIAGIGFVSLVIILNSDTTSWQYVPIAFTIQKLMSIENSGDSYNKINNDTTIFLSADFSWIFKYVLQNVNTFDIRDDAPIPTKNIIILNDRGYKYVTSKSPAKLETENAAQVERLETLFNNMTEPVAIFTFGHYSVPGYYPYTIIQSCTPGEDTQLNANF